MSGATDAAWTPLVSVIMPAYNAAGTIEASLRSILTQSYPHLEVLVVNDGSSDDTCGIVRHMALQDPRIRLLDQSNMGVSAARNTALGAARGEFVALLDADDLWYPGKLDLQIQAFREAAPEVALIYTWYEMIDADDRPLRTVRRRHSGEVLRAVCRNNFIGNSGTTMIRTAVVRQVGGWDPTLRACEDWKLHFLIASAHRFAVVEEVLAGYREHPGTATSDIGKMMGAFDRVAAEIRARFPRYNGVLRLHAIDLLMSILHRTFAARDWRKSAIVVGMMLRRSPGAALFVLAAAPAKSVVRRTLRLVKPPPRRTPMQPAL